MSTKRTYEELEKRIQELEQVELNRKMTEEELAQIFSMSLDMICIADINTATFIKVNPAFTEVLGYSEEELLKKPFFDFIHPDDIDETLTIIEQKLQKVSKVINFENRYRCKDGTYRWLSWVSHPNTEKGVTFAVARDITEWKQNKEALKRSKVLLDSTGRMARVGGWDLDADTMEITWTDETYRIHEIPLDQNLPLQKAINFFHSEDRPQLEQAIKRALDHGEPYDLEIRFITAKGKPLWTRTICHPVIVDGNTVRLKGTFQDITDRKRTEIALMKSEKKWRDILINTPQIGIVLNSKAEIIFTNVHFLKLTGWEEQEVIGRNWFDMFIPENIREEVRGVFKTVMNQKDTHGLSTYENVIMAKDGTLKNIAWSNVLTKDAQGAIVDVTCLGIDLTERKQVEEALQKSEERLNLIIKGSKDAPWDWDLGSNELYYSPQWWSQLGYASDELPANAALWERLLHPDDVKHVDSVFRIALKNGLASYEVEFRLLHKDGHYVPILSRGFITRDETGNPIRVSGTNMDLSERKQAEEQQRQSENKLRATLDATPFPVAVVDLKDDKIFYWSASAHELFGHTATTASGWYQIAYPDTDYRQDVIERWKSFLETAQASGRPVNTGEYQITCKDGSVKICELYASFLPDSLIVTFNDITDRKKAEASLYSIEWLLNKPLEKLSYPVQHYGNLTVLNTNRLILDCIGDEVLSDIVTGYLELLETSAAVYESNGDYAQGIFSSGWCQMLDSASRLLCQTEDNTEALACGKWLCHESCWTEASSVSIQKGEPVEIECNGGLRLYAVPIKANNKLIGAINFGHGDPPKELSKLNAIAEKYQIDVKELIKAANQYETRPPFIIEIAKKRLHSSAKLIGALVESKMSQSELIMEKEKLNVTLHSIGDGVITTDTNGFVVIINKVAQILTGWNQEDARGKRLDLVFHIVNEQTRLRCDNPVEKVLETNGIVGLANDTVLVSKDGTERIIADSGSPIVDHEGNTIGVVLVFRDVTEKTKLETELLHAHKMMAIGSLAGGIAHEFNNILSIIIGNNELIMDELPKWSPAFENAEEIRIAGFRARDVVKQLLIFSRQDEAKSIPMEIGSVVKESMKLIRSSIPANIEINHTISDDVAPVLGNPTQINQILINLCSNAADAMLHSGGSIRISLYNVILDDTSMSIHPQLKPGPHIKLLVSDTGFGMDKKTLDRIFEPYFTTKDIGKGTGIGLAVVHGIVEKYGGSISVESEPGKGTTFTIFFTAFQGRIEQEIEEHITLPTGNERILFVDDEPILLKLGKKRLERLGYVVQGYTDPVKALEMLKAEPDFFDMVITDMAMPYMTGDQLVLEILKIRPKIRTMLCTGYSEKISAEQAYEIGFNAFVMKPIDRTEFAINVRKVLDEPKNSVN
jgi:PAS domain S-box-containing protein